MAAVIEAEERVNAVHIEGLALLKIVKHCQESLPQMVSGSLLGLSGGKGVLEVTHAFPFPETRSDTYKSDFVKDRVDDDAQDDSAGLEGHEFQLEMMRMLREVNVDNNCVGWYQSMYLGNYSTSSLLETQLSYQTDLSPNAVVLLYDPIQTAKGSLELKCLRLTDECIKLKESGKNTFIDPRNIFEEVPVILSNPGLIRAFLCDVDQGVHGDSVLGVNTADTTFDRLDLSINPYLEKHLEFLSDWVDNLSAEQQKFQQYTKSLARPAGDRGRNDRRKQRPDANAVSHAEGWASSDAPRRMESLLITNQIRNYCNQVDKFSGAGFSKLFLAGGLHKEERSSSA